MDNYLINLDGSADGVVGGHIAVVHEDGRHVGHVEVFVRLKYESKLDFPFHKKLLSFTTEHYIPTYHYVK